MMTTFVFDIDTTATWKDEKGNNGKLTLRTPDQEPLVIHVQSGGDRSSLLAAIAYAREVKR